MPVRRAERWVWRWWAGEAGLPGALADAIAWPCEHLYRAAVGVRNRAYHRGWLPARRAPIPVISVGNLAVGGTGKTPLSAWLARWFADRGVPVAVAVRGYGADEIVLHGRWNPDIAVHAHRRRARAVAAAAESGARLAVLDDAFQHRAVRRDLDLVLLAAEGPKNHRLLPRGPFREPPQALRRADFVLITRRTASREDADAVAEWARRAAPSVPTVHVAFRPGRWQRLDGTPASAPRGEVLAVAGIARPELFVATLRETGAGPVELVTFPDHHHYRAGDAAAIRRFAANRPVVTTEKDAVKLVRFADILGECRVLSLTVTVESGEQELEERLKALACRALARAHSGRTASELDAHRMRSSPAP